MKTILTINKTNQKYLGGSMNLGSYTCPDCGGNIDYGDVSCPDERYGCLVVHYGYGCKDCKAVFDISFEKDKCDEIPNPPFIISEEIGVAIINPRAFKKGLKSFTNE